MEKLKKSLKEAVFLVILFSGMGFTFNSVSKKGIPLVKLAEVLRTHSSDPFPMIHATIQDVEKEFTNPSSVFVDARSRAAYQDGHIKNAISLPVQEFDVYFKQIQPTLKIDARIIVYCSGTECHLSTKLAKLLIDKGYKNIILFEGGWDEWMKNKLPTENCWDAPLIKQENSKSHDQINYCQ